jgi:hypothetical protein
MASVIDVTPVVLLSRVLRVSQHCMLVIAIGAPIIFLFDARRGWLMFAVAAALVYVALRYLPRPPIVAWICSVTLGAIVLSVWCLYECWTILSSNFTSQVIGPFVAVALVAYFLWRALRERNVQQERPVEQAMFGDVPGFSWFSGGWKSLLFSAVLLILALLIFQPTPSQQGACLVFGLSLLTCLALYFWLLPALLGARSRFVVMLLREIFRSRGHSLRASYFLFVLSRMLRSPKSIGLVFCALLVFVVFTVIVTILPEEVVHDIRTYLGGGLLSALTLLWRRARRYAMVGVIDVGSGPFILFLRSFMDDDLSISQDNLIAQLVTFGNFFALGGDANPRSRRFEELIAETVWPFGKMLAIGRPGEVLPQLGALRISTDNSGWQSMVNNLITRATHVLIAVGISSGIKWEFRQFEDGISRLNLSLIMLPEEGSVAATWRIFAAEYPDLLACPEQDLERSVAVRFDEAGNPIFLCARKKSAEAYRVAVNACLIPNEQFEKQAGARPFPL